MKKLIKALAFAAGAALFFNFASCSGGEESGEVKKSNLELAYEALSIPDEAVTDKIYLPSGVSPWFDVTITWTTSDSSIIAVTGEVTAKEGENSDTVILTATLKDKEEKTLEKSFSVRVPQNGVLYSAEELLEAAANEFKAGIKAPAKAWCEYEIPETITARGKEIALTLTSDNAEAAPYEEGVLSLYRTFVEVTVNLTLTYTLEGKTKTDTVELKLPEMTEFIYDRTSGSEHAYGCFKLNPSAGTFEYSATYEHSSIETNGFMGTYVLDAENKTITLSVSKVRVSEYLITDGWYTESELLNARRKSAKIALDELKALEDLRPESEGAELPSAADLFDTLYSLYELRATVWHEYCMEKETYKADFLEELGVSSLDDVDADPEKKAALAGKLKDNFIYVKRNFLEDLVGIPMNEADTLTWPQIYARYESDVDKKAAEDFSLMFVKNTTCDYEIDYDDDYFGYVTGALPYIDTKYDASKQWYEQLGDFGGYDEEQNMYTCLRLSYITCTGSGNFGSYTGSWNDDYTKYICEGTGEEPVVFTVTDNHNGTVSLAKGTDSPVVLNFSGEELIEWPWH